MEEISLRELIEVILRGKRVIAVVTLVFVLVSGVVSFFIIKPVYESSATVILKPIELKSGINPNTTVIFSGDPKQLDSARELDNKMIGSILQQISYPTFSIDEMVKYMNSKAYLENILKGLNIDLEEYDYTEEIKVNYDQKAGIITVSVKFRDADTAKKIKSAILKNLPVFMTKRVEESLVKVSDTLNNGKNEELKNQDLLNRRLQSFIASNGGTINQNALPESKKSEYNDITNSLLLSNQALEAYRLIGKELESIKATNIEKMIDLQVITDDKEPLLPVSPKKRLNLTIAFVLGLMVSIVGVFVREYWKNSGPQNSNG